MLLLGLPTPSSLFISSYHYLILHHPFSDYSRLLLFPISQYLSSFLPLPYHFVSFFYLISTPTFPPLIYAPHLFLSKGSFIEAINCYVLLFFQLFHVLYFQFTPSAHVLLFYLFHFSCFTFPPYFICCLWEH